MKISILTLFPKMFEGVFDYSIIKRAKTSKKIEINLLNLRSFGLGKHKIVDDTPYGGGAGMIMKVDVIFSALSSLKPKPYTILLSPTGKKYTQSFAQKLSKKKNLAIVCGRYEGVDARVEKYVDQVLSIGDFVLTGGEIAAAAVVDSVIRLIPGVISSDSLHSESFSNSSLLEFPQYTKPESFQNHKVPNVLLSGNHKKIEKWRQEQSEKITKKIRPDLLKK